MPDFSPLALGRIAPFLFYRACNHPHCRHKTQSSQYQPTEKLYEEEKTKNNLHTCFFSSKNSLTALSATSQAPSLGYSLTPVDIQGKASTRNFDV